MGIFQYWPTQNFFIFTYFVPINDKMRFPKYFPNIVTHSPNMGLWNLDIFRIFFQKIQNCIFRCLHCLVPKWSHNYYWLFWKYRWKSVKNTYKNHVHSFESLNIIAQKYVQIQFWPLLGVNISWSLQDHMVKWTVIESTPKVLSKSLKISMWSFRHHQIYEVKVEIFVDDWQVPGALRAGAQIVWTKQIYKCIVQRLYFHNQVKDPCDL